MSTAPLVVVAHHLAADRARTFVTAIMKDAVDIAGRNGCNVILERRD
jgi:hypothetical protein